MTTKMILAATLVATLAACTKQETTTTTTTTAPATAAVETTQETTAAADAPVAGGTTMDTFAMPTNLEQTASGLQYTIDQPGTGAQPQTGQTVSVHYTGWLTDGTKFDSSRDRGEPIEFPIGTGRVIQGWDEGVGAMKVGEKRTLVIPPDLGYGARGASGVIPPNATLVFKVELVGVR
jgi:peptidylprolyl isomerase